MKDATVAAENDITVLPDPVEAIVIRRPQCLITRYQPVAARIVGAGTSSVVLGNAFGTELPDGAVLVSCVEQGTSTSVL